ncbi:MAG: bifunctional histidinol-phosphatase/imidazoleglycerol-phosphate dehydratase HisB [Bacteroidetes bacterium]|jgi:imidazoleglycerol-phosphate dehydratase/histidinol-phosphatase|nr:bifunctional histidinol-phosphatase/imidazoleglycerol-phosphate dehydratase HisB [Bacteroidota bacterium]
MKYLFLDRDGTIIEEPPDEQVDALEKLRLRPGVIEGLRLLARRDFQLVLVTNQDGLGTPAFPRAAYDLVHGFLVQLLAGEGIRFAEVFVCPHTAIDGCSCRKPKTGLVDPFLTGADIDREHSFMIGDRETDVAFGKAIGVRTIRLADPSAATAADHVTPGFLDACRIVFDRERFVRARRTTNETDVNVELSLDGTGQHSISTGIGFFDHMLEQLVKHSAMDATITVAGDRHVDEHHSVEDAGLAIGAAIRRALGDKRGIGRYGFTLPMDESLASVALDLSGRPFLVFNARFSRDRVGELPTELVQEFFRGFADGVRATLHISAEGANDHHKIEAIFKSVARALRAAIRRDETAIDILPTTKGAL